MSVVEFKENSKKEGVCEFFEKVREFWITSDLTELRLPEKSRGTQYRAGVPAALLA